MCLIYHRTTTT